MKGVALVTGASSGIGAATARALAARGWRLVLAARREDPLRTLATELPTLTHVAPLDVRDREAIEHVVDELPEAFRPLAVLVNNAGLGLGLDRADESDVADWLTMIETNVVGVSLLTRAVLPMMVSAGGGHVVTIGSIAGTWPYPGSNVYGATKAFVSQLMLNLRADLFRHNIRATVIEPGMTRSEFARVRHHGDVAAAEQTYRGTQPLTPDDVAQAVAWVVEQPRHVTVTRLEMMPTGQAFAGFTVDRA